MRRRLAILFSSLVVLTGCTGIPHDSTPSAVEPVAVDPVEGSRVPGPPAGALPRDVVQGFLTANTAPDPPNDGANQYLTSAARQHWDAGTTTVVDNLHVGVFDPKTNSVPVTGTQVGSIDHAGVYTPTLNGAAAGTAGQVQFVYVLQKGATGWRIDTLRPGRLLDASEFGNVFRQRPLYFFDVTEKHLVPDPRWTSLRDPSAVAQVLIRLMAGGPRDALQSVETTELPAIADVTDVVVTLGSDNVTKVEIPGASSLGTGNRNRLAAQIGRTLAHVVKVGQVEITDNHKPVVIPQAGAAVFDPDLVTSPYVPTVAQPQLYFVRGGPTGGVFDHTGARVPGNIGKGVYGLDSVALANRLNTSSLLVAGTRQGSTALDIGTLTQNAEMAAVKLPPGHLSRPDWAPGLAEVWIGDGGGLYAVESPSGKATRLAVSTANGPASGQVTAVRLSPEGSRVALVLTNANQTAQLWIGAVVRGSGVLRVVNLTPISPQGVDVTDVAWNDELKLFAIGHYANGPGGVFEVQVDGSQWSADDISNLPEAPASITAASGVVAAVASADTIWQQNKSSWVALKAAELGGSAPIYSN